MSISIPRSFFVFVLGTLLACGGTRTPSPAQPLPADESPRAASAPESVETEPAELGEEIESLERDYGRFVRYELVSAKPAEAAAFYTKLLGWNITQGSDGEGYLIKNKGTDLAQIRKHDPSGPVPAGWMSWISVEDIDDMMRDVPANGGVVLAPPSKSEDGRVAVLKGPTGGIFGVIELSASAQLDSTPEPGDLVLSQLWTSDFDAALSFYSVMGDYTTDYVTYGKTKYNIMRGGGVPRALIRLAPNGKASRWIPFVLSPEPDKLAKKAASLGATVITEARAIPSLGRVAVIEVPNGGILGFIAPE